jgi:Spy/CpxP family protein refolding chaperone
MRWLIRIMIATALVLTPTAAVATAAAVDAPPPTADPAQTWCYNYATGTYYVCNTTGWHGYY